MTLPHLNHPHLQPCKWSQFLSHSPCLSGQKVRLALSLPHCYYSPTLIKTLPPLRSMPWDYPHLLYPLQRCWHLIQSSLHLLPSFQMTSISTRTPHIAPHSFSVLTFFLMSPLEPTPTPACPTQSSAGTAHRLSHLSKHPLYKNAPSSTSLAQRLLQQLSFYLALQPTAHYHPLHLEAISILHSVPLWFDYLTLTWILLQTPSAPFPTVLLPTQMTKHQRE